MDETEWPSIAGGEEKAEEEELKGEVKDEGKASTSNRQAWMPIWLSSKVLITVRADNKLQAVPRQQSAQTTTTTSNVRVKVGWCDLLT